MGMSTNGETMARERLDRLQKSAHLLATVRCVLIESQFAKQRLILLRYLRILSALRLSNPVHI
jgi:hypothetical protein